MTKLRTIPKLTTLDDREDAAIAIAKMRELCDELELAVAVIVGHRTYYEQKLKSAAEKQKK